MLPEFEQYKFCPACNTSRFSILNAEKHVKFFYKFHKYPVVDGRCMNLSELADKKGKDNYNVDDISINHIHVTCNKCGYEWLENTAMGEGESYE